MNERSPSVLGNLQAGHTGKLKKKSVGSLKKKKAHILAHSSLPGLGEQERGAWCPPRMHSGQVTAPPLCAACLGSEGQSEVVIIGPHFTGATPEPPAPASKSTHSKQACHLLHLGAHRTPGHPVLRFCWEVLLGGCGGVHLGMKCLPCQ